MSKQIDTPQNQDNPIGADLNLYLDWPSVIGLAQLSRRIFGVPEMTAQQIDQRLREIGHPYEADLVRDQAAR